MATRKTSRSADVAVEDSTVDIDVPDSGTTTVDDDQAPPGPDVSAGQEPEPAPEPELRLYRATLRHEHPHWGPVEIDSLWRLNPNHEHTTGALAAGLIVEVPDADQGPTGS